MGRSGLVESGDRIRLSVQERRLDLLVVRRRAGAAARRCGGRRRRPARGWDRIVADQVLQADEGCDLRVLQSTG